MKFIKISNNTDKFIRLTNYKKKKEIKNSTLKLLIHMLKVGKELFHLF